jgi:hypothetical protein
VIDVEQLDMIEAGGLSSFSRFSGVTSSPASM